MACGRCGTNQALVELITRNQIFTLLEDGTLQAGLVDCKGRALGKGTRVVTCDGLADAICELIENNDLVFPVIDVITLGPNNVLTIAMTNGDVFEVDFSRFATLGFAAGLPGTTTGTELPTTVIGNTRTELLGKPNGWIETTVGGVEVLLPYYTAP